MDTDRDAALLKYTDVWKDRSYEENSFYYRGGESKVKDIITELKMDTKDHITDWGCGSGLTAKLFCDEGLFVHGIDLAPNCLSEKLEEQSRFYFSQECLWDLSDKVTDSEWLICNYVLEHLPEKKLHAVLYQMHKRTKKGGFFTMSLMEDEWGPRKMNLGLHLTVRASRWWYDQLSRYWRVTYQTSITNESIIAYVTPKKENNYAGSWPEY